MGSYIRIRKSHFPFLEEIPVYKKSSDDQYVLYKSDNVNLNSWFSKKDNLPDLYIPDTYRGYAIKKITESLNRDLYNQIKKHGLLEVKKILADLFNETLSEPKNVFLTCLPETIELLFNSYSDNTDLIFKLSQVSANDNNFAEHSINVMFLVMNYGIHCKFSDSDVKKLSLMGLLHDIGKIRFPDFIRNPDHILSDDEFEIHKTHPILGHAILKKQKEFDKSIALGVLEHHEKLDGSGYPKGIKNISFEGQLLNIVNSFEQLTYREKKYRKAKKPFDAMSIIKSEILKEGKFNKEIFTNLCMSFSS